MKTTTKKISGDKLKIGQLYQTTEQTGHYKDRITALACISDIFHLNQNPQWIAKELKANFTSDIYHGTIRPDIKMNTTFMVVDVWNTPEEIMHYCSALYTNSETERMRIYQILIEDQVSWIIISNRTRIIKLLSYESLKKVN